MTSRPDYRIAEQLDEEDPLLEEEDRNKLFEYTKNRLNPKELWSDWSGSVGRFSSNISPEAGEGGLGAKLNEDIDSTIEAAWNNISEKDRNTILNTVQGLGTAWEGAKRIDNKYDPFEYVASGTAHTLEGIGKFWEMGHGLRSGILQFAGVDKGLADKIYLSRQIFTGRAFPKVPRKIPFVSTTRTPATNLLSSAISDASKGKNLINITDQVELLNKLNTKALTTETSSFLRKGGLFSGPGGSGSTIVKESQAIARAVAGKTPSGGMYAFLATEPVTTNSSLLGDAITSKVNLPSSRGVDYSNLKQNVFDWYKQQLKENNLNISQYRSIKRKNYGDIIVGGKEREISRIGEALRQNDPSIIDLRIIENVQRGKQKRIYATTPPKLELNKLGKQLGLSTKDMGDYYQDASVGFATVQEISRRQGLTTKQIYQEAQTGKKTPTSEYKPGQFHAGHLQHASKGGPTSGRAAGIEVGKLNIQKSGNILDNINPYAAELAGIPTTWAQDLKLWYQMKNNLPHRDYFAEFTNDQRDIIESIPFNATKKEVLEIFEKNGLDPSLNPNLQQLKDIERDLKGL